MNARPDLSRGTGGRLLAFFGLGPFRGRARPIWPVALSIKARPRRESDPEDHCDAERSYVGWVAFDGIEGGTGAVNCTPGACKVSRMDAFLGGMPRRDSRGSGWVRAGGSGSPQEAAALKR